MPFSPGTAMPPKQELSQEQIQEIRSLRGRLPAAEAKKRFGIGTTRLYKIWRDESASPGSRGSSEPATPGSEASPLPRATAGDESASPGSRGSSEPATPGSEASPLPRATAVAEQQVPVAEQRGETPENQLPTVADFYNRLGRLESRAEQTTNLLAQVLAQLSHRDDDGSDSDLLEELVAAERQEIAEQVQAARHEQTETRMDLQKVGQMLEQAQWWAYIAIAAVFVWKVAKATSNQCTPAAFGHSTHKAKPQHTTTPMSIPPLPAKAKPGDPFYME